MAEGHRWLALAWAEGHGDQAGLVGDLQSTSLQRPLDMSLTLISKK